jgi:hypothetical protein
VGTQKCAEDPVEAVDAVEAVRIFPRKFSAFNLKKSWPTVEDCPDTVGIWGSNRHASANGFNTQDFNGRSPSLQEAWRKFHTHLFS